MRTLRAASLFHSPHQFHGDFALVSHGFAVILHDFAVISRVVSQCFRGGFAGFAVITHDFAVASFRGGFAVILRWCRGFRGDFA